MRSAATDDYAESDDSISAVLEHSFRDYGELERSGNADKRVGCSAGVEHALSAGNHAFGNDFVPLTSNDDNIEAGCVDVDGSCGGTVSAHAMFAFLIVLIASSAGRVPGMW